MEGFLDGRIVLYPGDCLDVLKRLPDASIDSVATDPPYHLTTNKKGGSGAASLNVNSPAGRSRIGTGGFMGQAWDGGDTAFRPELWAEVLRVLKPGGHLLAFGGTRTYHRLACAIEDAGFEIRDMTAWLYGSGFPKSHNISKAIDKAAGAKRTVVPKGKPVKRIIPGADQNKSGWEKTNGREYQPGESLPVTAGALQWDGWGTALKPALEPICLARKPLSEGTVAANVLKWGTGALNIDLCRVATDPSVDDPRLGGNGSWRTDKAAKNVYEGGFAGDDIASSAKGRWPANVVHDGSPEVVEAFPESEGAQGDVSGTEPSSVTDGIFGKFNGRVASNARGDTGSAARFFYSSKADDDDRLGSEHPTVKPVDLMQYLIRLITPPGGVVLDLFAGTGTTGEAAWREGFRCVLIEREPQYQEDIRRRMALCLSGPDERGRETIKAKMKAKGKPIDSGPLFGGSDAP